MKAHGKHPGGASTAAKVAYRTVKINGLDIFYREAGAKDAKVGLTVVQRNPSKAVDHFFYSFL